MSPIDMKCWHCHGPIHLLNDGWICQSCGQQGPLFVKPAQTSDEGCLRNCPYKEREQFNA